MFEEGFKKVKPSEALDDLQFVLLCNNNSWNIHIYEFEPKRNT